MFYAALVAAVLGFGLLFDLMSGPAGERSVKAVESLLLVQEESEAAIHAQASDARLRRRPS